MRTWTLRSMRRATPELSPCGLRAAVTGQAVNGPLRQPEPTWFLRYAPLRGALCVCSYRGWDKSGARIGPAVRPWRVSATMARRRPGLGMLPLGQPHRQSSPSHALATGRQRTIGRAFELVVLVTTLVEWVAFCVSMKKPTSAELTGSGEKARWCATSRICRRPGTSRRRPGEIARRRGRPTRIEIAVIGCAFIGLNLLGRPAPRA
jgi:hypothetical protein